MANIDEMAVLQRAIAYKDISIWNNWLEEQRSSLHSRMYIADLTKADFTGANLMLADFCFVNLQDANFQRANLSGANFTETLLQRADFSNSDLRGAIFQGCLLDGANFTNVELGFNYNEKLLAEHPLTQFLAVDLSSVKKLETAIHRSYTEISISTFFFSNGNIPEVFLRGCGVPETMIAFAKSLVNSAIEYYSAFISYSSADEHFAKRLHNDLQMNGVRVWFAPKDIKIGDPLKQTIDEAVRLYDKLIIVLSEDSIHSAWVHHEFANALRKEKDYQKLVLFPIRLDESVFHTTEQWAYEMRQRHIGDFRDWTNPLKYQAAFNRLLQDLNTKR